MSTTSPTDITNTDIKTQAESLSLVDHPYSENSNNNNNEDL